MKLDAETRSLCGQIALARTRPVITQTAAEVRRDALRVMASGEPVEGVQAWLRGMLAAALAAQAKG